MKKTPGGDEIPAGCFPFIFAFMLKLQEGIFSFTMSFSDPIFNISQMELQSGMKVADFGAGIGFYTFPLSKVVGQSGRVYAVEIQKDLIEKLKKEAHKMNVHNIDVLWGDLEHDGGVHLREGILDAGVIANVLFQVGDKNKVASEIKRLLKPGGKLLVVDWLESFGGMGPHPDHVIQKRKALEIFESLGFKVEKDIRAGAHHWGVILRKM
jgi:ubiquinone/menaquinone biosynthesis C-methylase UbiE